MKVCVAQTKPVAGDISQNVNGHQRLLDLAIGADAEIIIFPELSTTGYEPTLANDLATDRDDPRFRVFQDISDDRHVTIGIGVPTRVSDGVCISLMLFQRGVERRLYSKMYLHEDEEAFFVAGEPSTGLLGANGEVALAICYELSVPEHAANASRNGAPDLCCQRFKNG